MTLGSSLQRFRGVMVPWWFKLPNYTAACRWTDWVLSCLPAMSFKDTVLWQFCAAPKDQPKNTLRKVRAKSKKSQTKDVSSGGQKKHRMGTNRKSKDMKFPFNFARLLKAFSRSPDIFWGLQHRHWLIATLGPEVFVDRRFFFWLSPRLQSGGSSLRAIMVRELGQCSQLTHAKSHGFQPSELIYAHL